MIWKKGQKEDLSFNIQHLCDPRRMTYRMAEARRSESALRLRNEFESSHRWIDNFTAQVERLFIAAQQPISVSPSPVQNEVSAPQAPFVPPPIANLGDIIIPLYI